MLPLDRKTFAGLFPKCPSAKLDLYLPHFNAACKEFGIDTPLRMAAFCAQLGHESGDLRWWQEFADGEAYDTGRLAARLGNTPEDDGDGPLYKGAGPSQLTGKRNFELAGKALGIDLVNHPARARDVDVGFRVAGWFWKTNNIAPWADKRDIVKVSRIWNGGDNGLDDRKIRYARNLKVLGC